MEETKDRQYVSNKLEQLPTLSRNVGSLYLNEDYSDVVFVVAGQRVPANKAILAVSSEYFRALLFGHLKESNQDEIVLSRIEVKPFKMLLKYIHTGVMDPVSNEDDLIDIISMAHMYQLDDLETSLSDALCSSLEIENVVGFMNRAQLRTMDVVFQNCCTFMDIHSTEILGHKSFLSLFPECLEILLSRVSFYESEILIFRRVLEWYDLNKKKVNNWPNLLRKCLRFSNISLEDHVKFVQPTKMLTLEEIMNFMQMHQNGDKLFRGKLRDNINNVSGKRRYDDSLALTITLENGHPWIINNIIFEHYVEASSRYHNRINRSSRSSLQISDAGYKVSVSCDGINWKTIVDYQLFSWDMSTDQEFYFEAQPVLYIKINIAHSFDLTGNLYLKSLSATFKPKPPKLVLESNILMFGYDGAEIQSYSRLWPTPISHQSDSILQNQIGVNLENIQYTTQSINGPDDYENNIIVILNQPYMISKITLLLRNAHNNYYHYYIELSTNSSDWEIVCDKRNEEARSWQEITFPLRPVVLIKIVGTHSSINNLFECANLQCYGDE